MHILVANIEQANPSMAKTSLNDFQKERLNAIHAPTRALQYFWSRVLYNGLLKRLTGRRVTWDLPKNRTHPPIELDGRKLYTSLSHSHHWICLGYDFDQNLGVDIELVKPRDWKALSQIAFDENVQRDIQTSDNPLLTFYCYWGLMECRIKLDITCCDRPLTSIVKLLNGKDTPIVLTALGTTANQSKLTLMTETFLENW